MLSTPKSPQKSRANPARPAVEYLHRDPTNPTNAPSAGLPSSPGRDPHQIAHLEMEHLSRASLQSAAYHQHLPSYIGADQKTALPQPRPQRLLAHHQALGPR